MPPSRPVPLLVALLLAAALAAGQEPPPGPVFGTGVDVVAVDVTVLDARGRPVTGLRPEEFQVTLDGEPRQLASAEFQALGSLGDEPEAPRPTHFSTNEGVPQGRLVVLAVDQGAMPAGAGRSVMNAAGRLLDRLTPVDRVALLAYPEGPLVEFTGDRDKLREALGRVVGRSRLRRGRVSPEEAVAIEAGDRGRLGDVVARECGLAAAGVQRESCLFELENEARRLQAEVRRETLASSQALRGLLRALARLDAPKSVVLVTQGLWTETPAVVRELADLAGQAPRQPARAGARRAPWPTPSRRGPRARASGSATGGPPRRDGLAGAGGGQPLATCSACRGRARRPSSSWRARSRASTCWASTPRCATATASRTACG